MSSSCDNKEEGDSKLHPSSGHGNDSSSESAAAGGRSAATADPDNETTKEPLDGAASVAGNDGGKKLTANESSPAAATEAAATGPAEAVVELSKNAKKRIARWERKMELKQKRKQQEKDIRLARAKAQGRDLDEERRILQERTEEGSTKRRRIQQFVEKVLPLAQRSYQICVDCSFEGRMTEREVASLAKQVRYCYALNRRTPHPCLMSVTSLDGSTLRTLQNVSGYDEWSSYAYASTADPLEVLFKDRLKDVVYLTSDSETIINDLDDSKIYVIGGIVDRNRLRGATLQRAAELGVATGKLPLSEHLKAMPTTPVLTVNHVFELLLKYREHGRDWKKAMEEVIPHRKQAEFETKGGPAAATADPSASK